MRRYTTANSVYEVDEGTVPARRFRRVSGANPPTSNFEEDGVWHTGSVYFVGVDRILFVFDESGKGSTVTSPVVSEEEV